ncbi:helix-turn-helix domain-containing protein [Nocardia carnea]|uniref:helix-turn-helix domain-containing protein n=1 Tax=Nocardia carnea TaxID=37328 RepID=UPI003D7708F1
MRERGLSIREVARRLGKSASTVSRAVRRNIYDHDRARYDADLAYSRAVHRARPAPPWPILSCGRSSRPSRLDWSPQ